MNVFAADTVYNSDVRYAMTIALIQICETCDSALQSAAQGTICVSGDPHTGDLLFDCQRKGLPQQTTDIVTLNLTVN